MFGSRQLSEFDEKKLPEAEPAMIHRTFKPTEEGHDRVRFDIRSIAHASHMSTTMFLERRVKAKITLPHRVPNRFTIKDGQDGTAGINNNVDQAFIRKPGFVLQQNLERMNLSFNGGDCVSQSEWLAPYTKCYEKSLKPFVRSSGKNFSNQNDQVQRRGKQMSYNAGIANVGALSGAIYYINPERNDRRVTEIGLVGMTENTSAGDGENQLPWVGQPHDIDPVYLEHPDTLATPLEDIGMFRPKRANVASASPEFDYAHDAPYVDGNGDDQVTRTTLDAQHSFVSDEFVDFYEQFYAAEDQTKLAEFTALVDEVWKDNQLFKDNWAHQASWNAIKAYYNTIFQTHAQANTAHTTHADITNDENLYEDTLGWGVDLRHPLWDMKGADQLSTRAFYMRTATAMLQFADTMQREQETAHANIIVYQELLDTQRRIDFLNDALRPEAVIAQADALLEKIDFLRDYENDASSVDTEFLEENGLDHLTLALLESQYAELRPFLQGMGLPYERNNINGDDYDSLTDQVETEIATLEQTRNGLLTQYQAAFAMFNDWDHTAQNRKYIGTMQAMSRWVSWYLSDRNKNEKSIVLKPNCQQIDAVFLEPMVLGPCRPTEYKNIGCWAKNSNILPFIERFRLDLEFKKDAQYFELDSYTDSHLDDWTGKITVPTAEVLEVETKLHCVFVEKPVGLPVTLPVIDVKTERLGKVLLTKGVPQEIRFSEIEMRRQFEKVLIYCKMVKKIEYQVGDTVKKFTDSDKSAAISAFELSTDVEQKVIDVSGRHVINALTVRNFPEYEATVGATGGVLGLVKNEIPKRKSTIDSVDHWRGVVEVEQDWSDKAIEVEIYMSIFRTDTMIEIDQNYQKKAISLS